MTPGENKLFIKRFVEEIFDRKNPDAINELVAENFVEGVPFPGQGPGRSGLKFAISMFLSAFPDSQWILDEQIAERDKVVKPIYVEWDSSRRVSGDSAHGKTRQGLGSGHGCG